MKYVINGIIAGILIALGGGVFLASENKYVGAFLFSIALMGICYKGYSLYTGKICYIPESHGRNEFLDLFLGLLGNIIGVVLCACMLAYAVPKMHEVAVGLCEAKLDQELLQTFIRAIFCGLLIFLAVDIFKKNDSIMGILIGIPVFILSGYEHSIADMFYFATASSISAETVIFIIIVILGNSVGGMLIPFLKMIGNKK